MHLESYPFASFPMLGYKVMPSLLPLHNPDCDETMSGAEEMEIESSMPKVAYPMDLTTKFVNPDKNTCYRTSSADSLITNGSVDDFEGEYNDVDFQHRAYRPRLPTADMVLMLNKHKRRLKFKVPNNETSFPLNLSTKNDKSEQEDAAPTEKDELKCSAMDDCACFKCCSNREKQAEDLSSEHNRFDWSEYRRSMSCSQIDFRISRTLAAHRLQRKLSVNEPSSATGSSGEASPAELCHDRDDGFHDELDGAGKGFLDIKNSPVRRLMNCRIGSSNSRRSAEDQALLHQDTSRLLMNEPPEAFVHTLEQLSFGNQIQKNKPEAFLQSLTDQYVPQYVKPINSCPVDAYGYYAHLMHRLQTHHVLDNNSHHSTPNLSLSPSTQTEESISNDGNNMFSGMPSKKRPPRALTGRHVREGTGASPSTLVSLRKAIEERQKFKKTDSVADRKSFSKKKCVKSSSTRPRAYSASLAVVRTVSEDAESDAISVASE